MFQNLINKIGLSSNQHKVMKNVSWAVWGKVVHIINGLLVGVLVARYLGPELFGLMNYVISYVMMFSVLASFGLTNIEIRELSKPDADTNQIMGTAFILRLFFAVITIVLILLSLIKFESDRETSILVMIYSLMLIFSSMNIIRNYFTSIIRNEYVVKTEIARYLVLSVIKIVLLICKAPLILFVCASLFEFIFLASGYLLSYRKLVGPVSAWKADVVTARHLLKESFPELLSGSAIVIYQKINVVMLRGMMDNEAAGQFSAAARIADLGLFLPVILTQSTTPLLVKARQQNPELYKLQRQKFMDIIVWCGLGISLCVSASAVILVPILFGKEYAVAVTVLQIMGWKAFAMSLATSSGQVLLVDHLQRYAVLRNLMGLVTVVLMNLVLIPRWGAAGAAVSGVSSMLAAGYFAHFLIKPYRYVLPLQTRTVFWGWKRLLLIASTFLGRIKK